MHTGRLNHQTLAATQLMVDMMVLNARDRISGNEFSRRMADAWLKGDDAGMASFVTCSEHVATICDMLSPATREQLSHVLGIALADLHRPSAWRQAFLRFDTEEKVERVGNSLEALGLAAINIPEDVQQAVSKELEDSLPVRDFNSGPSL